MGFVSGIWMAVLGILAAANLIIARKPEARELIAKISPYQGWIGAVSALWGIWGIISSILHLGWLKYSVVFWVTYLVTALLQASLGFLLGVGVIKTFVKKQDALDKMDLLVTKLAPLQGKLGLAAIGVGIWMIISSVLWRVG